MAETTKFGHDRLGHLLADHLLEVPRFQRAYSWDKRNVEEYLKDLDSARANDVDYFMGTVVFAHSDEGNGRRQIVDGQQRLATTAILIVAIRDRLQTHGQTRQAEEVEKRFLRGYVLTMSGEVERLILSPDDLPDYQALLAGQPGQLSESSPILQSYRACAEYLELLSPTSDAATELIALTQQLEDRVQVLVAEASDLPEAYVIFETLNDRGADLTTADLLKNYLFSCAQDYFAFIERRWAQLEASFDRPDALVRFIRYEFVSRNGATSGRRLYRAIQAEIEGDPHRAKEYIDRLVAAHDIYLALRDPEHAFWSGSNTDVRDALYSYRRFGFEPSTPVLMAAFLMWPKPRATKLLVKVSNWLIRAQFAGRLGGGVADDTFGGTARAIANKQATNQTHVREMMSRLISSDEDFRSDFLTFGNVSVSRAKWLFRSEWGSGVAEAGH